MDVGHQYDSKRKRILAQLTRDWGDWETVSLYLDRCRVDTPDRLVEATWHHVTQARSKIGKVVDFGAGDGRFAKLGAFKEYIGYEIDARRTTGAALPSNARLVARCAFSEVIDDADLCIGNPPFVRNQDLPLGWRQRVSKILNERTGVSISGLANAWQYFFLLSLASVKSDGLVALVVPYEWVSRPSAMRLRDYVVSQGWDVSVYRLVDATFDSVLTTSSITVVDKASTNGKWSYFEETADGKFATLLSPSGSSCGVIKYLRRRDVSDQAPRFVRGLSPGTQRVLTLTEGERVRYGLVIERDVVPCVTTLRPLPDHIATLTESAFLKYFRSSGQKCWLVRTDKRRSKSLRAYLDSVPEDAYQTSTCLQRSEWWKFKMPDVPQALVAMSFRKSAPKSMVNAVGARAVGGVYGFHGASKVEARRIVKALKTVDLRERIVAHSNGLRKIEVNQLNALLKDFEPKRE